MLIKDVVVMIELLSANPMRSAETDARSTRLPATSPAQAVMRSLCARGRHEHVSKRSTLNHDKRRGTNGGTDLFHRSVPAPGQG